MQQQERENLLKLYLTKGVGTKFIKDFYKTVGSFEGDLKTLLEKYIQKKNLSGEKLKKIKKTVLSDDGERQKIIETLKKLGIEVIPFYKKGFPKEITLTDVDIAILFCKGYCENLYGFSIVGTRKVSGEGRKKAEEFASSLASIGITVISGGANGVDKAAHMGALKVGGKTGVVLGEGIFSFLKRNNRFAEEVLNKSGFIISQFPPTLLPTKWTFPQRNALIAALGALGTLVVEAGIKSGALITAYYAHKLGRKVYAYLGCTQNPAFGGNVQLLEEGKATLVTGGERLLKNLRNKPAKVNFETKTEKAIKADFSNLPGGESTLPEKKKEKILSLLTQKPLTFDEIAVLTSFSEDELTEILIELELEGEITQEGGFFKKL